jgi:hypothetical protein
MAACAYRLFGGLRFVVAAYDNQADAQKRVPPEVLFVRNDRQKHYFSIAKCFFSTYTEIAL